MGELDRLVLAGFLAFCRVGACFMLLPGLSSARVPLPVRLFVALAVSFALFAHLSDLILPHAGDSSPARLLPLIAGELALGALIGLLARLYVLALQFIASAIAMLVGYGGVAGPSIEESEPQAALASLITFSALLLLFVFDFHHEVVAALVRSYEVAPVGEALSARSALIDLADTLREAFLIALRLGSPFVAYAILVNLAVGFINKLVPQIPVYFISQPFVIAGGLILLYFGASTFLSLFADGFGAISLGGGS
ncbi:MAG TPA: flagellar biosynthetic protein FliR [Mesorhizobium sp.]|jgi:flagellar biosynthetic protein FliR|nr:flagellar biosynthetic protein FliR [Mesorhizobium sp.]